MRKSLLALTALAFLSTHLRAAERPIAIDKDHSRIEAAVKSTLHDFTAQLTSYEAELFADSANTKITRAVVTFKIGGIRTGDVKRDRDMLAWINEDRFPDAVFSLVALEPVGGEKWKARGQLILHGVPKDLAFEVSVTSKDQRVFSIDGAAELNTQDFGLPVFRKYGLLKVDPLLHLTFHLQGSVVER